MKRSIFFSIVLILSLIILAGLAGRDEKPFQTDKALADSLAEISGQVIIPKALQSDFITIIDNDGAFAIWIATITFTNKGYENPFINNHNDWCIVAGNNNYQVLDKVTPDIAPLITVPAGQTREIVICFWVPDDLNISDALLKFTSHDTASYGTLSGGEHVPAYDWESKTIIEKVDLSP
jgi:hypothetical protein